MPEAPELEVTKDVINERASDAVVRSCKVLRPSVLRPLAGDFASDVEGRTFHVVLRAGKFLIFRFSGDRMLVVNPMLTGLFQHCDPSERVFKRTCFSLLLSTGRELRYLDDRQMGRAYYLSEDQLGQIPQLGELGPDVLERTPFEDFQRRLSSFRGEIKGVLTRGRVISGIGNAYSDEILFEAKVYPYQKVGRLSEDELRRIHQAAPAVVEAAIPIVRERMGGDIHQKVRDFLKVHRKGGQPCPRCGNKISEVTANRRITSYCRSCQPGLLVESRARL